jgi:polysaccharide export outer membrane protein
MTAVFRAGGAIGLSLLLAACALPRGAGLESEVLAVADPAPGQDARDAAAAADFGVWPVTRDSLLTVAEWPGVGLGGGAWITRQEQPASLLIAPGDTIRVSVWDAEENSLLGGPGQRVTQLQDMQVSSAGSVFLPFVGEIRVAGMAQNTARERIEERYAETIPSAQVQLLVTPGRANTASLVAGAVNPGVYPLADRDVTVLGLLAMGGGVSPGLPNPRIRLFRGRDVYETALDRLYDDPDLDTTLQGGDRVIVEAEERYFLSLGAAGTEARHLFPQDVVTALDALSIIGGVAEERANPQGVLILRDYPVRMVSADPRQGPPKERMVFTIDLTSADGLFSAGNFRIMPNDLIYVTESPLPAARGVLGLIGTVLGLSNQL